MGDPRLIGMTKPALISLVQSRNLRIEELESDLQPFADAYVRANNEE